jgi:hypothetical protein
MWAFTMPARTRRLNSSSGRPPNQSAASGRVPSRFSRLSRAGCVRPRIGTSRVVPGRSARVSARECARGSPAGAGTLAPSARR